MLTKKPKHIFIVEDNQIYAMMLDYILSKDSIYQFVSFKSGEECIDNLYLNPDVIILDYGLPGKNGYETLLEIKKHNPHIHVVMLTNNDDKALKNKILNAGADDYVLKQGHGETQIIEKIEAILIKDEIEKTHPQEGTLKSFFTKLFGVIVIAAVIGTFINHVSKNKLTNKVDQTYTNNGR